jgi:hypothetical protein
VAGAWLGHPRAGPTSESCCRGREPTEDPGGQLTEATERPTEVSAWARVLAETWAVRVQARCWRPPSRWRSFRPCHRPRPGQILPKVETTPRVLLLPLLMSEPAGTICL